jgi:nitrate reductase assembly molybdenum cofactor insertion protein NarJ
MAEYDKYRQFANLFRYPDTGLAQATADCIRRTRLVSAEAAHELEPYYQWVIETPLHEVEEVFSRTFHIQAVCYLDLGYVIFGEDYKRGEFLVNMKREQAFAGNDCGDELPDNLVNVLNLLPLLTDAELRDDLGSRVLIPALRKMLAEFDAARMEMREKALRRKHSAIILEGRADVNIYRSALNALLLVLLTDFNEAEAPVPVANDAFLRGAASCGSCATPHTSSVQPQI